MHDNPARPSVWPTRGRPRGFFLRDGLEPSHVQGSPTAWSFETRDQQTTVEPRGPSHRGAPNERAFGAARPRHIPTPFSHPSRLPSRQLGGRQQKPLDPSHGRGGDAPSSRPTRSRSVGPCPGPSSDCPRLLFSCSLPVQLVDSFMFPRVLCRAVAVARPSKETRIYTSSPSLPSFPLPPLVRRSHLARLRSAVVFVLAPVMVWNVNRHATRRAGDLPNDPPPQAGQYHRSSLLHPHIDADVSSDSLLNRL